MKKNNLSGVQIKINNNLPHIIRWESIVQMLGMWDFILTLDDSTSHYIIATSAPLDLLKNTSEKNNNLSDMFKLKSVITYHTWCWNINVMCSNN